MIPTWLVIYTYVTVFYFGAVIGSFFNVLTIRIPRKENFVTTRSHCDSCGYQLEWYDLVPIFSYVFLRGKCRKCKASISAQHLCLEVLNGLLYIMILFFCGMSIEFVLYCLMASCLMALSVIDFKTYIIPVGFNNFIGALGIVRLLLDYTHWYDYLIGAVCVSGFIVLINIICNLLFHRDGMGDGDYKLMAAAGLVLGWKLIILAFLLGCILGSILHSLRMKFSGQDHELAFGPYLSAGIMIALLWGNQMIDWYLTLLVPQTVV